MGAGKREAESEGFDWDQIPFKKIAIIVLVIALVIIVAVFAVHTVNKRKEEKTNAETNTIAEENVEDNMPNQYEGYNVLGELVIEKIGLDKYIVDSKEDDAMAKAPTKLYGADVNTNGNLCIAGHNYEEVFAKLNELAVGDQFYIIDTEETIQDYKVTEVLEVEPTDLTALMPVQDKMQVTLITCIEGATKRLVVKAERIQIEG